MYAFQRFTIQSFALSIVMLAVTVGCDRSEQGAEPGARSDEQRAPAGQYEQRAPAGQVDTEQEPLGHVMEFDGFTLRANVTRTDVLPDAVARQYDIKPEPNLVLFNLVILENRADAQPETVSAEVSARYQSLSGHVERIALRKVESDGHVSYIGTFDASSQRTFKIDVEAQPAVSAEVLRMDFEVQLDRFDVDDHESNSY